MPGYNIMPPKEIKYFEVVFLRDLRYAGHVDYAVRKAAEKMTALTRLLPNIGGPDYEKGRALCGVAHS